MSQLLKLVCTLPCTNSWPVWLLHRYDAGSQKKLIITTETHTILEQFDSIGLERISEIIEEASDLKSACAWMARSIDGVAKFSALKAGGSMMFAGELLQNDDGPVLGDDEGASTCLRCLVHAVATEDPDFPTWYVRTLVQPFSNTYEPTF